MNKKIRIIAVIIGVILLLVVIFLSLFFNRKREVRFYLDNGANVGTIQVKYNKMINEEDIKANFRNGILTIEFPKEPEKKIEEKKYIPIGE